MLDYLKKESNWTRTENGALTHASSGAYCVDLFGTIGALRRAEEGEIVTRFLRAYSENPDWAMKTLFFARDVRGGLGERRVFRTCFRRLAWISPMTVEKNIPYVAEYGRWDDLLCLLGTPCEEAALEHIRARLRADLRAMDRGETVSLLAKWLPSVNASNPQTVKEGKRIAAYLDMDEGTYRKTLAKLRANIRILENHLRQKDYTFDYSIQPSKAMVKYRKAFIRNDSFRYGEFMDRVERGEAKLNTGTLTPYELVRPLLRFSGIREQEARALDTTWKALEDFTGQDNALVVVDGSGSMYSGDGTAAAVALSLGIYFAERNTGAFHNHFMTFSEHPQMVEIKGDTLGEKVRFCESFNEVANTNIQRVFELILRTAQKYNVPQEELPTTVYIVSDMEFDSCAEDGDATNFDYAKRLFAQAGYALPNLVFWNVESRNRQQPVTFNDNGVALVSGCTPRLFSMVAKGDLNPLSCMLDILLTDRYKPICA